MWTSEARRVAPDARVLALVEDDVPLLYLLADEIRGRGFEVVQFYDGQDLLDYCRAAEVSGQVTPPDVVVAEADLPGCSGFEACERLRDAGNEIPVVLMCPEASARIYQAAAKAGATTVLEKPIDIDALADAVASAASVGRVGSVTSAGSGVTAR
jgi:two-component system response regulator PrrA